MRELTEEEIELVNSSLESSGRRMKFEKSDTGASVTKTKVEKIKSVRKRPIVFRPAFWGSVFILIPTVVTLAIASVISRVDSAMGSGALQTLSELSGSELKELGFDSAGLDWVPQVVQLYESRTLILVLTWSVSLAIAATLFFFHFRSTRGESKTRVAKAQVSLEDEMEELNRAYWPELAGYDDDDSESDGDSETSDLKGEE